MILESDLYVQRIKIEVSLEKTPRETTRNRESNIVTDFERHEFTLHVVDEWSQPVSRVLSAIERVSKGSRTYSGSQRGTKGASCAVTDVSRSNVGVYHPLDFARLRDLYFFHRFVAQIPPMSRVKFFPREWTKSSENEQELRSDYNLLFLLQCV